MDLAEFEALSARVCHEDLDILFRDAWIFVPPPDECLVNLPCYKERIAKARSGDTVAVKRLLDHIWVNDAINPDVRNWLNECLALISQGGVSADKAFGVAPENGRPPVIHSVYDDVCVWKDVEVIRRATGYTKLQATFELEDIWPGRSASTLGKMHQRGARYVAEGQRLKALAANNVEGEKTPEV